MFICTVYFLQITPLMEISSELLRPACLNTFLYVCIVCILVIVILLPVKYLLKLSGPVILPITYDVIDINESFHDFMFVNRAPPPPPPRPASVNLVLQHGGKPCKVSIALFVDYSYYSSTIRGLFVLFVDYSRTIRTIRGLFALFVDYSYYSSTIRTIRTIRFTILVLSIAIMQMVH